MSEMKNQEAAKAVSCNVFAIKEDLREKIIKDYCDYCRLVFILKFIIWRMYKLRFKGLPISFDWEQEVPHIKEKVANLERSLFEDLDPEAAEILMKSSGDIKSSLPKPKITMKKIKWKNDFRLVRVDDDQTFKYLTQLDEAGEVEELEIEDPGPCPVFVFMPTKVQLMKMILKAAYTKVR